MNCQDLDRGLRWVELVMGELAPALAQEAETHVLQCPRCRAEAQAYRELLLLLPRLPPGAPVDPLSLTPPLPQHPAAPLTPDLEARLLAIPRNLSGRSPAAPALHAGPSTLGTTLPPALPASAMLSPGSGASSALTAQTPDGQARTQKGWSGEPAPVRRVSRLHLSLGLLLSLLGGLLLLKLAPRFSRWESNVPELVEKGDSAQPTEVQPSTLRLELALVEPSGALRRGKLEAVTGGGLGVVTRPGEWVLPVLQSPDQDLSEGSWHVTLLMSDALGQVRMLSRPASPQRLKQLPSHPTLFSLLEPIQLPRGLEAPHLWRLYLILSQAPPPLKELTERAQVRTVAELIRPRSLLNPASSTTPGEHQGSLLVEVR